MRGCVLMLLACGCSCVGEKLEGDTSVDEVVDEVDHPDVDDPVVDTAPDDRVDGPRCTDEMCDDGLYCTGVEWCDEATGLCRNDGGVECFHLDDECNRGYCDEEADTCRAYPLPETSPCDDGDPCTEDDHCDGAGSCTGTPIPVCGILPDGPLVPRNGHVAVWTGSEMIVWGGVSGSTHFGDGARYSPSSGTWTTMGGAGAPSPRARPAMVWTGSEVIVWGGNDASSVLGDGAMYDPSTDTWRDVSMTGAPSARGTLSVVWTGSEMMVWGGATNVSGGPFRSDGGLLDPSMGVGGTWTSVPAETGSPSARGDALIVWTGSEVYIWGGATGTSTALSDGASYDLSSWSALPYTDTRGRYQTDAVWTGSEMIFWGGWDFTIGSSLSNGARLGTGWSALTACPLPTGHSRPTTVWTGTEVIVWGGHDYGTPYGSPGHVRNDGARYEPVSRAWTMMEQDPAVTPRTHHKAVWTGSQMLVFGGGDGSSAPITTAVGASYTPCP